MANKNKNLNDAAKAKKDEFYTQFEDIQHELIHYAEHFRDKVIFCNCDDPYESEFFKFFAMRFNTLGLKKLITTNYVISPIFQTELSLFDEPENLPKSNKHALKIEISEVPIDPEKSFYLDDLKYLLKFGKNIKTELKGDEKYLPGDFRSKECVECLKEADIVVTNPPFSLFREYVKQLIDFDKKFVIIGNKNAITYKEIFPLIMQNKMWSGYTSWAGGLWFYTDDDENFDKVIDGKKLKNAPAIWYTNLDIKKRHEDLALFKKYSKEPELFPKYDNYDAIEVSKTNFIPCDYDGIMGVPITFLDKYNPDQFEIVGMAAGNSRACGFNYEVKYSQHKEDRGGCAVANNKRVYARILIRRKK